MLLGSTALDVAIGLIFIYLVVSLICSSVNEGLEAVLKNRSKDLERGIREMLTSSTPGNTTLPSGAAQQKDLVQQIYDHPLISGLFKGDYQWARSNKELPSYIPSRNFAGALLDTLRATMTDQGPALARLASNPAAAVAQLREAAAAFQKYDPKISAALVSMIDAAGDDVNRARQNIENWFDSSMDRVSGWYKRRTQYFIFGFGLAIAAFANIDSVGIVRSLSTQAGLRDALVAQASSAAKSSSTDASVEKLGELRGLGLPLGWDNEYNRPPSTPKPDATGIWIYQWALKILGILLTGFAVTLGAPFWFDLLNRFIVVRSTVKPTEKSPPEKSKE